MRLSLRRCTCGLILILLTQLSGGIVAISTLSHADFVLMEEVSNACLPVLAQFQLPACFAWKKVLGAQAARWSTRSFNIHAHYEVQRASQVLGKAHDLLCLRLEVAAECGHLLFFLLQNLACCLIWNRPVSTTLVICFLAQILQCLPEAIQMLLTVPEQLSTLRKPVLTTHEPPVGEFLASSLAIFYSMLIKSETVPLFHFFQRFLQLPFSLYP
mmetsp:Transcript_39197/g.75124  ORF Transcript_39197/g.75124 Transcript_39197/m.75124 type:complete len:214 (+) Transcript_39197:1499-2140(+)